MCVGPSCKRAIFAWHEVTPRVLGKAAGATAAHAASRCTGTEAGARNRHKEEEEEEEDPTTSGHQRSGDCSRWRVCSR